VSLSVTGVDPVTEPGLLGFRRGLGGDLVEPAAVRALERKGLITSQLDGRQIRVRLAHPIYGDVVRAGISAIREQEMARALADAMESAGTRHPEHTLRLAALRLVGGGGGADVFLAGAISSKARYDYILADRLARAAIEQGAGFEARLIAAWAVNVHGRTKQADGELAELANRAVSDAERARVALARFNGAFYSRGETNFALLYEAIDIITDQFWRNEIQARVAFAKGFARGPRTAVAAGKCLRGMLLGRPLPRQSSAWRGWVALRTPGN
jgi:hypothetical protein